MKTTPRLWPMLIFALFSILFISCEKDEVFQDLKPIQTKDYFPDTPTNKFYTGFAYGDISFIDAGLSDKQWGWITKYQKKDDTLYLPIYIRDEHYDGGDGRCVGEFRISCMYSKFVVEYHSMKGWAMMETDLYVSHKKPETCDPAEFNAHHHLFRKTVDRYVIYADKLPVYVIGHVTMVRTQ